MNKKILLIVIIITFSLVTLLYRKNYVSTVMIDGIKYAIIVDGEFAKKIPEKGLYQVITKCENAKGIWDYQNWYLKIRDITGEVACDVTFNTITKNYLNSAIIKMSGTTQGYGKVINENGYRYEGQNPNNWIQFNNELWRIIGVFDSNTHGVENVDLVKIIRIDSIGVLPWSSSNNNWSNSSLYNLLNGAYYNKQNAGDCYYPSGYDSQIIGICDYSNIGIDVTYRSMIKEVTWKLGGHSTHNATAEAFYNAERGSTVYNGRDTQKEGFIGLIYPSDYGYSVLDSNCSRTKNLSAYRSLCAANSWLRGLVDSWTLTHRSSDSNAVFNISPSGNLDYRSWARASGYNVRPTLYLNENVYVLDGTGSESDPYIIGMDEVSE